MNQITPFLLRVGHVGDGQDVKGLFANDVRAVVQLAWEESPLILPRELITCRFPLADGPGNPAEMLRLTIGTITHLLNAQISTLVCCSSGLSRAPALAAAGLAQFTGRALADCLREVTLHRHADVHPALVDDLEGILATLS